MADTKTLDGPLKRPWFEWKREVGEPGCSYLQRTMLDVRLFSIRLHHFRGDDDDRALHDHPWWFFTLILKGGYTDVSEDEERNPVYTPMKRGRLYFRKAHHKHTVKVNPGGVWTLCLMGPRTRDWGFWTETKGGKYRWFKANKYFSAHGHHKPTHPCE